MATSTEPAPAPSLSLPGPHFAKLAPAAFLAARLPGQRPSGRSPAQARPLTLNAHSLTHAHGSAVVRVGATAVVCGVRGAVVRAADTARAMVRRVDAQVGPQGGATARTTADTAELRDADELTALGLLVPNIELATGCSPLHLPGNPPGALAQSLTQRVLTLLRIADLVRFADLQIWSRGLGGEPAAPGATEGGRDADERMEGTEAEAEEDDDGDLQAPQLMAFWTLFIDILVISLDGSPFDAAWAAVVAALRDTRLPEARWDRDLETVLCDPRADHYRPLSLRGCPIALSFAAFNPPLHVGSKRTNRGTVHVLVDPDDFEEGCCAQTITVVVDQGGNSILRVEMSGGDMLDPSDMRKLVKRTGQRWEECKAVLESAPRSA